MTASRDSQIDRLLDHCDRIPDAEEVFLLLDLLREMEAISADESAAIMRMYWDGV